MKSSFHFKNGHRITVYTCGSTIQTKIMDENWNPVKDYATGYNLHCSEAAYHKTIRDQHAQEDFVHEQSDALQSQSLPAEPKLSDKIGHINCDREALKDPEFVNAINHMAELAYHKVNPKKEVCSCGYPNSSAGYNTNWKMVCSSCGNPKSESFQSLPAVEQPEKSLQERESEQGEKAEQFRTERIEQYHRMKFDEKYINGFSQGFADGFNFLYGENRSQQPSQPEGKTLEEVNKAIADIKRFSKTHYDWAEYFEANPEIEAEHVATGKWDSAATHREIIADYENVLNILREYANQPRKEWIEKIFTEIINDLDIYSQKLMTKDYFINIARKHGVDLPTPPQK